MVNILESHETIQIPQDSFSDIVIGAKAEFTNTFRRVNLTCDTSTSIRGGLTVRIDSANEYLVVGPEWANVITVTNPIILDVAADVPRGRILYDSAAPIGSLFQIRPNIGLIEMHTALSCFFGVGGFTRCLESDVDMRPVECPDDVCAASENRTFVVYGDLSFNFAPSLNISLLYANGGLLNLAGVDPSLNLTVGTAFGNTEMIVLAFGGAAQTLAGLYVTDPVNITVPDPSFVFTVDYFAVDFRSFKRFFKDVGVFTTRSSLKVRKQFLLDEETRYHQIVLSSQGWQLIGNENAWNTTLSLGSVALVIPTEVSVFTVSSDDYSLRASLWLHMKTPNARVVFDPSVLDIYQAGANWGMVTAASGAVLTHSYKYFPNDTIKLGPSVTLEYVPLTRVVKQCYWSTTVSECTMPDFTPINVNNARLFEPAASTLIELHGSPTLAFIDNSATNITIYGNRNLLWITVLAASIVIKDIELTVHEAELHLIGAPPQWPIQSLATDYYSVAALTVTFQVSNRFLLSAPSPLPSQRGSPAFTFASTASVTLLNAESLPVIRTYEPDNISLSNEFATFWISDFPANLQLPYSNTASVFIGSAYASSSDITLVFQQPGSALTATTEWSLGNIPAIQTFGLLDLSLLRSAAFRYLDGSAFIVSPETLANMEFANIETASVTISSDRNIVGFTLDATAIVVQNVATVDRSSFIGPLMFNLNRQDANFRATLGSGIPQNVMFNLSNGVSLTFEAGFSHVTSPYSVNFVGENGIVYFEGYSIPSWLNVSSEWIVVILVPTPTATPFEGLTGGKIAVLVIVSAVWVGVMVFTIFTICRRRAHVLDYDKFPDIEDKSSLRPTSLVDL
jgi:hypothetical protein